MDGVPTVVDLAHCYRGGFLIIGGIHGMTIFATIRAHPASPFIPKGFPLLAPSYLFITQSKRHVSDQAPADPINQSYHGRKHGNKSLPLSSFLDPARIRQRQQARHRLPKPRAPKIKDLDPFRKRLAGNPYGGFY
jgi:hypothetical protein